LGHDIAEILLELALNTTQSINVIVNVLVNFVNSSMRKLKTDDGVQESDCAVNSCTRIFVVFNANSSNISAISWCVHTKDSASLNKKKSYSKQFPVKLYRNFTQNCFLKTFSP
jgi:hypothetical protein